jgi:hypothetical protein
MALKSLNGVAESCKLKDLIKVVLDYIWLPYLINRCTKFYVPASCGL